MTCLAIAIAALGIAAMRRAWCCHGYYGHGWCSPFGDHGHHGWHGRHHARARMMLHALFMRIDASPAQERAIIAEFEKLQDRVGAAKAGLHHARLALSLALQETVLVPSRDPRAEAEQIDRCDAPRA